jgi:predicted lipid-binding transport protein (Tim44 family)
MWHLFGPLIRWPLHSPLRLLGVIASAVVAVMLLGALNDRGPAPADEAGPSPAVTVTATAGEQPAAASPAPSPTGEATASPGNTAGGTDAFSDDPTTDEPVLAAQQAAAEFVAAWARPDLDTPTWQAGLAGHATPELLESLTDTDPANVPAVTVSGQPVEVAANAEAGVFDVPTTGELVRVHVQLIDGAWLATDVEPTA